MNLSRRNFSLLTGAAILNASAGLAKTGARYPFTLGVASSYLGQGSMMIWTRLAPEPLSGDGGMPPELAFVRWEVAEDESFNRLAASGHVAADPKGAHSVRAWVRGLAPDRPYWYRFLSADAIGPIGRFKTLPAEHSTIQNLKFATAGCQHYEQGFFSAYDHLIEDDPDFVLHMGDFIYGVSRGNFRSHERKEKPVTLDEYRVRHALYALDPSLQRARAAMPFICLMDNHDALPDMPRLPEHKQQRQAAYQAWYEHMPLFYHGNAEFIGLGALGSHAFGNLLSLNLLNTRQYRDSEAICDADADPTFGFGIYQPLCDATNTPERAMLGAAGERWLKHDLKRSLTKWNALASSVLFSPLQMMHDGKPHHYKSSWDFYPANRVRVLEMLSKVANPVVLSGDIHANLVANIPVDPERPNEGSLGAEFLTTSISSDWPEPLDAPIRAAVENNPHIKHYDASKRGYTIHDVSRESWTASLRTVSSVRTQSPDISTQAMYEVEAGRRKVQ